MVGWAGNPSFDLFKLPEEYDEMRSGGGLWRRVAPHAAEGGRFPEEALVFNSRFQRRHSEGTAVGVPTR